MEPQFHRPNVDDQSAYREAIRRAEEGVTVTGEDGEVVAEGQTPDIVELQGAVPVQASDQPLEEPAVQVDTSQEQQQEVPAEPADPRDAEIARLREQLDAKESFIGRQSTEIGELRSAVDEIRAAQQAQPAAQVPLVPVTQADIDNDPADATLRAFENAKWLGVSNDPTLQRAFNEWKEVDPWAAGQWLTDRRFEEQEQRHEAQLAEVRQQVDEKTAPTDQQLQERELAVWNAAFNEVRQEYPEFFNKDSEGGWEVERVLKEYGQKFPAIAEMISNGDVAAKAQGIKALIAQSKLGDPAALGQELQDAAKQAEADAAAARQAAGVVSGQDTVGQATEQQTEEEQEIARQKARIASGPSLRKGWSRMSAGQS